MAGKQSPRKSKDASANLGFEAKLWLAADKLRNSMDAGEYKHIVLGLIIFKYISALSNQRLNTTRRIEFLPA